jgi:hypothetical protein
MQWLVGVAMIAIGVLLLGGKSAIATPAAVSTVGKSTAAETSVGMSSPATR